MPLKWPHYVKEIYPTRKSENILIHNTIKAGNILFYSYLTQDPTTPKSGDIPNISENMSSEWYHSSLAKSTRKLEFLVLSQIYKIMCRSPSSFYCYKNIINFQYYLTLHIFVSSYPAKQGQHCHIIYDVFLFYEE